jgi:phenylalanyl-tRNA synthetase alpha chain
MSEKILSTDVLNVIKQRIQSLENITNIRELQKEKNLLLKDIKELIGIGNACKSSLISHMQNLLQNTYDIFKKQSVTLETKNRNMENEKIFLPYNQSLGELHPITKTIRKIYHIMNSLQFSWTFASEVDYIENIFDKLNMGPLHPAREDQQSFYIDKNEKQTIRTHCTNFQSEIILPNWNEKDEIKSFHMGKVYRADSDATHTPMFHQFEVFYLNKDANIATLMGFMKSFFNLFFEKEVELRIRTSFFPFTTPSYEVDILLNEKWLEIGGCGIVHENVFKANNKKFTQAWAWGMGIERITMIQNNYKDIRNLYKNDIRYF